MAQDFFRKSTDDEKRDFTDIGPLRQKTAREKFAMELGQKRLEADKKKIPFFKKAAMDDFEGYYKEQATLSLRKNGFVKVEDIKPIVMDWAKYSSPENIVFVEVNEQRDAYASKKHPFDVLVKAFRYKYKGYGEEGTYNMSVMEEEAFAVKRARAKYENKPELEDVSPAEKNSKLYGNGEVEVKEEAIKEPVIVKSKGKK
jgi:hypothetical protein